MKKKVLAFLLASAMVIEPFSVAKMVNKTVTLRLPKKVYTRYKELIKASGVYSKTKFVKF